MKTLEAIIVVSLSTLALSAFASNDIDPTTVFVGAAATSSKDMNEAPSFVPGFIVYQAAVEHHVNKLGARDRRNYGLIKAGNGTQVPVQVRRDIGAVVDRSGCVLAYGKITSTQDAKNLIKEACVISSLVPENMTACGQKLAAAEYLPSPF